MLWPMQEHSLILISDDPLARAGLAYVLSEQIQCTISAQMSSQMWFEQTKLEEELSPEMIVWDVGWEIPSYVTELVHFDLPILALVSDVELAVEVWGMGIQAVLRRDVEPEQLEAAMQAVLAGLSVLEPTFLTRLSTSLVGSDTGIQESLTPRELEVLQLLAEGKTNKAIAHELDVSSHTVKFHVTSLMGKLNAQSRTEAVVRATRLGLIAL